MPDLNRWWAERPKERFGLEVTDAEARTQFDGLSPPVHFPLPAPAHRPSQPPPPINLTAIKTAIAAAPDCFCHTRPVQ